MTVELSCVPAPLPDELAQGHMGRIFTLAGIPERKRHLNGLSVLAGVESRNKRYLQQLAELSSIPLKRYIYDHTMVPFFSILQERTMVWAPGFIQWPPLMQSARKGVTETVRLCPQCVEQDIHFLGFSYWRRKHQLLGVTWCVKHQCGLYSTGADESMRKAPDVLIEQGLANEEVEGVVANSVVRCYGEICSKFLMLDAPISLKKMLQVIRDRAHALGLRGRPGAHDDHLDKLALKCADHRWLQAYFPDVFKQGRASSVCRAYSSTEVAYPAQYYAFALALLFDSADDALATLKQVGMMEPLMGIPAAGRSADEERAISEFIAELPWRQLAEKYGLRLEGMEGILRTTIQLALR